MRITVCFKTMADTAMMAERDWVADDRLRVDVGFIRQIFNCFDESALEMALRIAGKQTEQGQDPELTALTVDDKRAVTWLRHLYAVGYHRAVRIPTPEGVDIRFNPDLVSRLLAEQVRLADGQDLVLTGCRSGEGDNRRTGLLIAERLGWPCITNVADVRPAGASGRVTVTSLRDGAELVQAIELPAVLVVGNAARWPYLRRPTLKQRMLARSRPVTVITPAELGVPPSAEYDNGLVPIDLVRRRDVRACEMIPGTDATDKARRLWRLHLEGRLSG